LQPPQIGLPADLDPKLSALPACHARELAPKTPPHQIHRRFAFLLPCRGVRVDEVADPLMREIRYLDRIIDELAKGADR